MLICLIAPVAGSVFGTFFSVEPTEKGMTLKEAVQTLNAEYYNQIKKVEANNPHDRLEYVSAAGSVAIRWEDGLSVFAADTAADEHGQQAVALDDGSWSICGQCRAICIRFATAHGQRNMKKQLSPPTKMVTRSQGRLR